MRRTLGLTCLVLLCLLAICPIAFSQMQEVTIGAQVWDYDRVYPLLDGLFQDAASTQLQPLILDPNKANSSQLDALIQSFQVQAGFNQLSGVQNSVVAQMAVANLGYQSALAQQQQSILQQSITAQQALVKANQDLAMATQSNNQPQINAANLEVQNAQALVNGLNAEAALVKGSGTPWTPSPASGNIAATPTSFTSGVPPGVLSSGSSAGGPSFPATKQLDNQMDLLWSRLARVVGAMTRPDSIKPDSRTYMIEFDTATFPSQARKGRILETRYVLDCGEVVDLFPRVAAVNVANTKYRDNADIFGVILSWFSFGINASYNREHLKMSQTLGQSSYITGYGVDQHVFGWKFGIPLGDNFVSADTKRTFALVSVPSGCPTPHLALANVIWERPNGSDQTAGASPVNFTDVDSQMINGAEAHDETGDETSISFNRVSYDPTKYTPANPVLVAVSVSLKDPIDQQATLYANGILLKRARDTFGRAIPNGSGSGGLLEESVSIAQANTWMPISPHNLLITLDAGQFGATFPTIQIINPGQESPIQISSLLPDGVHAIVSGRPFECFSKPEDPSKGQNSCQLPSLAYQIPVNTNVDVFLWQTYCDPDPSKGCVDNLVLQAPPASTSTNTPTGSGFQVVSGSGTNPWGANAEVYLQLPPPNQKQYRLNCDSSKDSASVEGGNLVCQFWDSYVSDEFAKDYNSTEDLHLQVIDPAHGGGALVAGTVLPGSAWGRNSNPHPYPQLWGASNPQWYDDASGGHWEFQLRFANADKTSLLIISPNPNQDNAPLEPNSCDDEKRICTWKFTITARDVPKWFNRMNLSFRGDPDDLWYVSNIKNQISPYVTVMSADFSSWSGNNFTQVFSSAQDSTKKTGLLIGTDSTPISIDCPVLNSCVVTDPTKLPKNPGVMYLMALNQKFPLLQLNSDGTTLPINFQPKSTNPAGGGQAAATQANPTNLNSSTPSGPPAQSQSTIVTGGSNK